MASHWAHVSLGALGSSGKGRRTSADHGAASWRAAGMALDQTLRLEIRARWQILRAGRALAATRRRAELSGQACDLHNRLPRLARAEPGVAVVTVPHRWWWRRGFGLRADGVGLAFLLRREACWPRRMPALAIRGQVAFPERGWGRRRSGRCWLHVWAAACTRSRRV